MRHVQISYDLFKALLMFHLVQEYDQEEELSDDNIMPEAFNPQVAQVVAEIGRAHV